MSPHPKRPSHEHSTPPMFTDKTGAADPYSSSSRPPRRPSYATDGRDDSETHIRVSPTGEIFFTGPESTLFSSSTIRDPNKHLYLIPGRNLAALHDTQQEMNLLNAFLHEYLIRRQSNSLIHDRLSRMIETRWWGSIGCPLCFLCEDTETEHSLHTCKRDDLRNKDPCRSLAG